MLPYDLDAFRTSMTGFEAVTGSSQPAAECTSQAADPAQASRPLLILRRASPSAERCDPLSSCTEQEEIVGRVDDEREALLQPVGEVVGRAYPDSDRHLVFTSNGQCVRDDLVDFWVRQVDGIESDREAEIEEAQEEDVDAWDGGDSLEVLDGLLGFDDQRDDDVVVRPREVLLVVERIPRCPQGPKLRTPSGGKRVAATIPSTSVGVFTRGARTPSPPRSSARWMNTGLAGGTRTIGIASVPFIAISMCSTSAESSPLCSVSMTSQSNPACASSSAALGLPRPRKQPIVGSPARSFSLTQFSFTFSPFRSCAVGQPGARVTVSPTSAAFGPCAPASLRHLGTDCHAPPASRSPAPTLRSARAPPA